MGNLGKMFSKDNGSVLPGSQPDDIAKKDAEQAAKAKAMQDASSASRQAAIDQIKNSTDLDNFTRQELLAQAQSGGINGIANPTTADEDAQTTSILDLFNTAKTKADGSIYAQRYKLQQQLELAKDKPGQQQTILTTNQPAGTMLTGNV